MAAFLSILPFVILSAAPTAVLGSAILWSYRASGFLNITHGFFFVAGGMTFALLRRSDAVSGPAAAGAAVLLVGVLSVGVEFLLFRRLRQGGAGSVTLLLAAFAAFIVGENLLAMVTANATAAPVFHAEWGLGWLEGLGLNSLHQGYLLLTVCLLAAGELALIRTTAGIALRAVSENPELAALSRVPERAVAGISAFGSGALAASAGIFVALDVGLSATDGMSAAIAGAVAAIFGGLRWISGVVLGALFVAALKQSCVYLIGPHWQDFVTYTALAAVLYLSRHRLFEGGVHPW